MSRKIYPFLLPIRCIIFVFIFSIGAYITHNELAEISNWWSVVATIVNFFVILLLIYLTKKADETFFELINYKKGSTKVKEVIVISIVVLTVGMAGMYFAGFLCYGKLPYMAPMMIAPIPGALAVINVFLLPITTALAEDALYLGCGVNQIKNKGLAIVIPAFFFALQHSFIPTLFDGKFMLYRFLSFLPLTFILCMYYRKKRNPLPIMIGHAMIDLATVMWILTTSLDSGLYEKMCDML